MVRTATYVLFAMLVGFSFPACKREKPVEQKKPAPIVVVKPKPALLSAEQRRELGFPDDIISQVELAAGSEAEPFYATVFSRTENLKGEPGIEARKLAGFSVHARGSDDLIDRFRSGLRARGYLIFKSQKGYGNLPDIVSVMKGNNSYDIVKIQATESQSYHLDNRAIIAWLKEQQKLGSFAVIGAGPDWLEARFIKQPRNMETFARKIKAFAPDVLAQGPKTTEKLAERMKKTNGFYLEWD